MGLAVEFDLLLRMLLTESFPGFGSSFALLSGLQQIEKAVVFAQVFHVKIEEACLVKGTLLVFVATNQRFGACRAHSVAAP